MDGSQQFLTLKKSLHKSGFQGMIEYEITEYLYTNQVDPDFLNFQYGCFVQYYYLSDQVIKVVLDKQRYLVKIYIKYFNQPIYKVYDWRLKISFAESSVYYGRSWMKLFLESDTNLIEYTGWDKFWFSFLLEMGYYQQVEYTVGDQNFLYLPSMVLLNSSRDFILSEGKVYHQFGEILDNTFRRVLTFKYFEENVSIARLNQEFLYASTFKQIKIPNPEYFELPQNVAISFTQPSLKIQVLASRQLKQQKVNSSDFVNLSTSTYDSYLIQLIEKYFQVTLTDHQKETPKQIFGKIAAQKDPVLINQLLRELNEKFS